MDDHQLDKRSQNAAKKYLEGFIAGLQNVDLTMMQKRGHAYKRAWKNAVQECRGPLDASIGIIATVLHGDHLVWSDFLPAENKETVAVLAAEAEAFADRLSSSEATAKYVIEYAKALGIAEDGSDVDAPSANNLYRAARVFAPPARGRREQPLTQLRKTLLSVLDRRE